MKQADNFVPQLTEDGSFTFFSSQFGESFHSCSGARQEALLKFVKPTQIADKAKTKSSLRLLDICYGLGYNTAAALVTIWAINPNCYVEVIGLESNLAVPQAAIAHQLISSWSEASQKILIELAKEQQVRTERLQATLLIGDARATIEQVYQSSFQADAIFLDPFSPPKCPQLWTVEFLERVVKCLHPLGLLATYSSAAAVRAALLAVGLNIGSTPPVGRRAPGTIASFVNNNDLPKLSQLEQEHLLTRAAVPYRDPQLNDSADAIKHRRQLEQQASCLKPASKWRRGRGGVRGEGVGRWGGGEMGSSSLSIYSLSLNYLCSPAVDYY